MRRVQEQPAVFGRESALALMGFVVLYVFGALLIGAGDAPAYAEETPGIQSSWSLASLEPESEAPAAPAGVPSQVSSPERPGLTPLAQSDDRLESRSGWVLESQIPGTSTSVSQSGYPELWSARGPPESVAH